MIVKMSIPERAALSRKHNPNRTIRNLCLTNTEMHDLILDLYGLNKLSDDPQDLTFEVEDDKKYMMYLLTR